MISLRFDKLAAITGGTLFNTEKATSVFSGVSIDSRTTGPGELFVAIKGEANDGHQFISKAIKAGAAGIMAQFDYPGLDSITGDRPVVAVNNSHEAMIGLAADYRKRIDPRIAAITGSNGKTTTKELAYCLISAVEDNCYRSPGNLNNLYGLPLSLFSMPTTTAVALLELGISTPGEMKRLAEVAEPNLILITNVGPSHLQNLKTVADVARAKLDLVVHSDKSIPVILNGNDQVLMIEAAKLGRSYITFGLEGAVDFKPESITVRDDGFSIVIFDGYKFVLPLHGKHQVANLAAAYACFRALGFSFDSVDTESIKLATAPMRGQTVVREGITIVSDCYNANPDSVKAGLAAFFERKAGRRRILILGDMLELGTQSIGYHDEVGRLLASYSFDIAYLIGNQMQHAVDAAVESGVDADRLHHFNDAQQAASEIAGQFVEGDMVYIKGSRGVGLETIITAWAGEKVI